jgi:hypothetical protein
MSDVNGRLDAQILELTTIQLNNIGILKGSHILIEIYSGNCRGNQGFYGSSHLLRIKEFAALVPQILTVLHQIQLT